MGFYTVVIKSESGASTTNGNSPTETTNSNGNKTYTFTWKANGNGAEPHIRLQLDKPLDLEEHTLKLQIDKASTSTEASTTSTTTSTQTKGTLTFDFDSSVNTEDNSKRRSMSLKLASTKDGGKAVSLKGNLSVIGSEGGTDDSGGTKREGEVKATNHVQFKAELDGGVTGDIELKFTSTSDISIGNASSRDQVIEVGGGVHTMAHENDNSSDNRKIFTFYAEHNIRLNGYKNSIKGGIKSYGCPDCTFTNIVLGREGSELALIEKGIYNFGGMLNLDLLAKENEISGEIHSTSKAASGSNDDYYGDLKGVINLKMTGITNRIKGDIKTDSGSIHLSLYGDRSQTIISGSIKSSGGNTHLSIKGDHLKIDVKALEVSSSGKMNVSFAGNNSTLRLRDAQHQISTLTTSSSTAARSSMNNMIDLSSNPNSSSFTLLEIGTKSTNAVAGGSGAQAGVGAGRSAQAPASGDQAQTSAFSGNYSFKVYVDPNKQDGKLGNQTSQSRDSSNTNYGNAYSDRILIYEDTKEKSTQSLLVVVDPNDISNIHYTEGKGTETAGNVAVATVKSTATQNAQLISQLGSASLSTANTASTDTSTSTASSSNIEFIAKEVINGGERIQVKLKKVETDEYGKVSAASSVSSGTGTGTGTNKGYITYFIDSAKSLGADPITQKLVASALATNYDLYLANFNSLNKRMGELRNNPNNNGVWARVFGGAQESKFGVGNQTQYITLQGGYDYKVKAKNANNYMGLALSYAYSQGKSKKVERANNVASNQAAGIDDIQSNGFEVAIYNSFVSDIGWYNDSIAKFSYISSSFILDQSPEKSKTTNYAATLSNEVGYRYVFGEKQDYYLDPQVELGLGYVNQSDFKSKLLTASGRYNNLSAIQNHLLMLRTRAGASLGKIIYGEKNAKASLYFGAFYEYDFVDGGENKITLGSGTTTTDLGSLTSNGRVVLNLGSNININDNTRMYVDVEKSFGDKLRTHLQFNLGARYSF